MSTQAPLILGTAQLGLAYGRNRQSSPDEDEASDILSAAWSLGVREVDTARAYGESEARIGAFLKYSTCSSMRVITKLSPLADVPPQASEAEVFRAVDASVEASMRSLGVRRLSTLLLHRAEHLAAWNGAVWRRLAELQSCGEIEQLGCSIQNPAELEVVAAEPLICVVQMPYNLLDWRWRMAERAEALGVEIHVRSVLLQGLLTPAPLEKWPNVRGLDTSHLVGTLHRVSRELGREDIIDLCINAVRGRNWVAGLVVGVDTVAQLTRIASLFNRPALTPDELNYVRQAVPRAPEQLLDPAKW